MSSDWRPRNLLDPIDQLRPAPPEAPKDRLPLDYKGANTFTQQPTFRQVLAIPEVGVLIPLAILIAGFYLLNPSLLRLNSIASMLRAISFFGIIAVGQTLLMVSGELDLSVGTVAGLGGIVAATLMSTGERGYHWPVAPALMVGLLTGATVGLANGLLSVVVGIPAFITTLGMLFIARGLTYVTCAGYPVYPLPASLLKFGDAQPFGVSSAFVILVVLAIVADLVLRKTTFGRAVYATGGNREVARIAGINTTLVKISCYVLTSMLAATAGMLLMAQLTSAQPESGAGWELYVIASVVIGGVSLFGGIGTVTGTFLGLLVMQVVRSGLVLAGIPDKLQDVASGVIMIAAVWMDLLRRRTKRA